MQINEWLKDVYYDEWGTHLWSKQDEDGGSQLIGDIRGWGRIQHLFPTQKESEAFQDSIGKFIADAINEKILRDYGSK